MELKEKEKKNIKYLNMSPSSLHLTFGCILTFFARLKLYRFETRTDSILSDRFRVNLFTGGTVSRTDARDFIKLGKAPDLSFLCCLATAPSVGPLN